MTCITFPPEWIERMVKLEAQYDVEQQTLLWRATHNGKTVTADSPAKAIVMARELRIEEEKRIVAERLANAPEKEKAYVLEMKIRFDKFLQENYLQLDLENFPYDGLWLAYQAGTKDIDQYE